MGVHGGGGTGLGGKVGGLLNVFAERKAGGRISEGLQGRSGEDGGAWW